jgi:hypothetical protein
MMTPENKQITFRNPNPYYIRKLSAQLRQNEHSLILTLLERLNFISNENIEYISAITDYLLRLHGEPSLLFLKCFENEVATNSDLALVMKERSISVRIIQFMWRSSEIQSLIAPFAKISRRMSDSQFRYLTEEVSHMEKEKSRIGHRLSRRLRNLFCIDKIPISIAALCYRCTEAILKKYSDITKAEAIRWTVESLIFLRFIIPSVTALALNPAASDMEKKCSILIGRLLMKIICKSNFSELAMSSLCNLIIRDLSYLMDQFCDELYRYGLQNTNVIENIQSDTELISGADLSELYEFLRLRGDILGTSIIKNDLQQIIEVSYTQFLNDILFSLVWTKSKIDKTHKSPDSIQSVVTHYNVDHFPLEVPTPISYDGGFSLMLDDMDLLAHQFPINPSQPLCSSYEEGKVLGLPGLREIEMEWEKSGRLVRQMSEESYRERVFSLIVDDAGLLSNQLHIGDDSSFTVPLSGKAVGLPIFDGASSPHTPLIPSPDAPTKELNKHGKNFFYIKFYYINFNLN